jgi:hypothetical protein
MPCVNVQIYLNKRPRKPKRKSKMDNLEKLARLGTQLLRTKTNKQKTKKNELTLYICNNFQVHTLDFSVNVRDVHLHPGPSN